MRCPHDYVIPNDVCIDCIRAERDRLRTAATCGCGDECIPEDPATCGWCVMVLRKDAEQLRAQLDEGAKRSARASRVIAKLWEQRRRERRHARMSAMLLAGARELARMADAELARLREAVAGLHTR